MGCNLQKQNTTLRTEDISKNITQCNLHLHGQFLHAWSHITNTHSDTLIKCSTTGINLRTWGLIFCGIHGSFYPRKLLHL